MKRIRIWTRGRMFPKVERMYWSVLGDIRHIPEKHKEAFIQMFRHGITYADEYPDWIPTYERMPDNGDKVLCYLDDDSISSYTYYTNNKEVLTLFRKHVVAWMYIPKKPKQIHKQKDDGKSKDKVYPWEQGTSGGD